MWKPLRIENRKGAMGRTEIWRKTSTGCEQVEKAGWTGSDGDRHSYRVVLCDFLPYPVQFANNCHPRSHEVEGNTSLCGGTHPEPECRTHTP